MPARGNGTTNEKRKLERQSMLRPTKHTDYTKMEGQALRLKRLQTARRTENLP